MLFFVAIVGSFVIALIVKLIAVVLRIENRSYRSCYIAVFLGFCFLAPFILYASVENSVLLFAIKFFIFWVTTSLVLSANFNQAAIMAAVLSILVSVSVTRHPQQQRTEIFPARPLTLSL